MDDASKAAGAEVATGASEKGVEGVGLEAGAGAGAGAGAAEGTGEAGAGGGRTEGVEGAKGVKAAEGVGNGAGVRAAGVGASRPSPMRALEQPGGLGSGEAAARLTPVQRALVARGDRRELLEFLRRRRGA